METRPLSKKRENRFSGSTWVQDGEEKGKDRTVKFQKKNTKWYFIYIYISSIFTALNETKICHMVKVPEVIACVKFKNYILRCHDFTQG